jgi:pyruvate/2-oxoglutarate/acetoin dehydrogenase E1 component
MSSVLSTEASTPTADQELEFNFSYRQALSFSMEELGSDERVVFLGQSVAAEGTFMSSTLAGVPLEKRLEFPVAEELQLGVSIGMALAGMIPVSVFPRWNFLILAANQLVNHLDKLQPHVIVRVGVGSVTPLHPGPQHVGDFTEAFRLMMPNTPIIRVENAESIVLEYRAALKRKGPTVIVEFADLYAS